MFTKQIKITKKLFQNQVFKAAALTAILAFTFILRAHNYDREPVIGQLEEHLYAWAGINLLYDKVPMSWSTLDYPESAVVYKGEVNLDGNQPKPHVTLVSPWLDEPPIYSYISGGSAYLFGDVRWDVLPSSHIRLPQIFISFFISIMVFLIARAVSGFWTGFIAALIYGTSPLFVIASRLAVPENLITLIFMIIIYLILKERVRRSLSAIILIPILIGIAGLSKPTGFFLAPLVAYELFKLKRYKGIAYLIFVVGLSVGLFFLYGFYYSPEIFMRILEIQSGRPVGFGGLGYMLSTPAYDIFLLFDTMYIFCFLSLIYYAFSYRVEDEKASARNFLVFCAVYWIIVVLISGGEYDLLPWYRFGFFPLLAIFGAWGLKEAVVNFSFVKSFLAVTLFLGNRILLVNPFRPNLEPGLFRIVFSTILAPALGYEVFRKNYFKVAGQAVIIGAFIIGTYMNIVYIYNAQEIKCESIECPIGPSTIISRLHFPFIWRFFVLPPPTIR